MNWWHGQISTLTISVASTITEAIEDVGPGVDPILVHNSPLIARRSVNPRFQNCMFTKPYDLKKHTILHASVVLNHIASTRKAVSIKGWIWSVSVRDGGVCFGVVVSYRIEQWSCYILPATSSTIVMTQMILTGTLVASCCMWYVVSQWSIQGRTRCLFE